MLCYQYWTKNYKHEYLFTFKGKKYLVHSIVSLTKSGKLYLETTKDKAILTEHFINWDGKECWTYEIGWADRAHKPLTVSTDKHPDKIIKEVIEPANSDYAEREIFGSQAYSYTKGTKHVKKDWEIPEIRRAWLIFLAIFIGSFLFKDWYVQYIIIIASGWFLGVYRQAYINAYTTYTYEEDKQIIKNKYEILYGVKYNKEDNNE